MRNRVKKWLALPELPLQAVDEAFQAVNHHIDGYIKKHDRRRRTGPLLLAEYEAGKQRRATDRPKGDR